MKSFILFFLAITLLTVACKKGDNGPVTPPFSGRWNLVSSYISTGGPGVWVAADKNDPKYVQFNNGGKLESNIYNEYATYALKDSLTVVFSKTDNTIQNFMYVIKKDTLILGPSGPIFCIEGCALKFTR